MRIKRKIKKYSEELQIPEISRVLPENVIAQMEEQVKEVKKPAKYRAYMKWVYSGAGVAIAGIAALVICLNANRGNVSGDRFGQTSQNSAVGMDGVIEGDVNSGFIKGEFEYAEGAMDLEETKDMAVNGADAQAGTLTGGEIRDNVNWDNWLNYQDKEVLANWKLAINDRLSVYVHNGDTPLLNCKVVLYRNQETVYTAITDIKGNAYLYTFNQVTIKDCDTIEITCPDGAFESYKLSEIIDSGNRADIELEGNNPKLKLDLMFMVDTTGSMDDELNYLKEELKNVVTTVNKDTGADIRTSVNFYRDTTDEYIVKYYDFRKDIDEACKLIDAEEAAGGGDFPEAVHTAIDNAINQHVWEEDSIKLMFLVLDAPPHDDDSIKAQIAELMSKAASQGIRIIPVAASGADEETQQILRAYALLTGGTFTFLDDNSGVGESHTIPIKEDEYESEYLNSMLIRIIGDYCGNPTETKYFRQNSNNNNSN